MARTYFYVLSNPNGWEVRMTGQTAGLVYPTKDKSLDAARGAGRINWEQNGIPSGVRVQRGDGTWQDEMTYGQDPFPPRG